MSVVSLIGVGLVGCDRAPAVALLVLSNVGGSMIANGYDVTPMDMAPNHVGEWRVLGTSFPRAV